MVGWIYHEDTKDTKKAIAKDSMEQTPLHLLGDLRVFVVYSSYGSVS
jgi:hypothetical protein